MQAALPECPHTFSANNMGINSYTNNYARHYTSLRRSLQPLEVMFKPAPAVAYVPAPQPYTAQKATIHQVTTILATSKNVLFPSHNHLLTTGADDVTPRLSPQCQWLAGGYDLDIGHF